MHFAIMPFSLIVMCFALIDTLTMEHIILELAYILGEVSIDHSSIAFFHSI